MGMHMPELQRAGCLPPLDPGGQNWSSCYSIDMKLSVRISYAKLLTRTKFQLCICSCNIGMIYRKLTYFMKIVMNHHR